MQKIWGLPYRIPKYNPTKKELLRLMIKILHYPKGPLTMGIMAIFLIVGDAGFLSSTVDSKP